MSDQETAIKRIHSAAKRREQASAERRKATEDLRRYCLEAQEAGIPVTRIASEAGLSRQGVYDLLAERPSP